MARSYKLQTGRTLDKDALLRSLGAYDLATLSGRWRACLTIVHACQMSEAGESEPWLWAYGLHMAMAGHEEPWDLGNADVVMSGYRAGVEMLSAAGVPVETWAPMGQRRAIGSSSPGRCWLN